MIFTYLILIKFSRLLLGWQQYFCLHRPFLWQKCIPYFYFSPTIFCSYSNQIGIGGQYYFVKNFMEREKYVYVSYMYVLVFQRKPCLNLNKSLHMSFIDKWRSSSPQWAAILKLITHYCALTCRADVRPVRFTATLVYKKIQVATVTLDSIRLGIIYFVRT